MVYDNLAAQIEDPMAFFRENDESVADDMESMRRFNQERLKREKEQAREQTRQTMEFGNEDFSAPYHGIRRMPRPEAKRSPKEEEIHNLSQEIGPLAQKREEEHGFKLPSYDE